jgi:hypothetical protein
MKTKGLMITVIAVVLVSVACGGARTVTEKRILEWGPVLNVFMSTNFANANAYPTSLDEVPALMAGDLKTADGWGRPLLYRRLRIDLYNIISAGADGEFGNDDDIVMQNGMLYEPSKVYSERPLNR